MVTASHNPRTDNGYKVYGSDGALLAAPDDEALAQLVGTTPLVQTSDLADETHARIVRTGDDLIDAYVRGGHISTEDRRRSLDSRRVHAAARRWLPGACSLIRRGRISRSDSRC